MNEHGWHTQAVIEGDEGLYFYVLKAAAPSKEEALALVAAEYELEDLGVGDVVEVTVTPCKGHAEYDLFFAEDVDGPGTGWPYLEPTGPHAAYWKVGDT